MSSYALEHEGEIVDRVTLQEVCARFADVPEDVELGELEEFGVFYVADPVDPEPDLSETETLDLSGPVQRQDGSWGRDWVVHRWLEVFANDKRYARLNGPDQTYPYTIDDFRADWQGVSTRNAPFKQMDDEWGIVEVDAAEPPEAGPEDVAEPNGIEQSAGRWREAWTVRTRTADELAVAKVEAAATINGLVQAAFAAGFSPSAGPLAGHTLQVRSVEDRTNWLTSQAAYSAAVAAGHGDVGGATFRTAANETVTTTYMAGLTTLLAMAEWGKLIMQAGWAKKDAIDAAGSFTALALIALEIDPAS